jgi:hypothetical protein
MEPANTIVKDLGGPAAVAALAGVHRTRVYGWLKTGVIPLKHIPKLIAGAKKLDKDWSADRFMPRTPAQGEAA